MYVCFRRPFPVLFAAAVSLGCVVVDSRPSNAAIVHDEAIHGELSNDNFAPTVLNFTLGENTVIGDVANARDFPANTDVFRFVVPDGAVWDSLILTDYRDSSPNKDNAAFLAIDDSDTFPYDSFGLDEINNANPAFPEDAFIGGTVFGGGGPTNPDVGRDLLPRAANVVGAGYTTPLPSGDYTIYIQQTDSSTGYSLTVNLVSAIPEPSSTGLLMLVGTAVAIRRRR
ncbi:PEP-CTERM sorting domain-containing protein [Stieleria sp. ICT_E10.1]|uniref:PEP-CTERM sorting domain-containing protein n=1 Tax=Stieleria sedimenti TaxID=2976331 RepID=UPI00217FB19E|nr:PEP-CTERM sorting domain-containing protein [Stieleria sedimenti]MCS7468398.1 PEP-CTERM sorting domain-containing protein [Stieleria sedimenti]